MIRISTNFTLDEFLASDTARREGIDNTSPSITAIVNLTMLVARVLQPLRNLMKLPIRVTSGYRCAALNKAVGGAYGSQHMTGQAADISFANNEDLERKAIELLLVMDEFDQLIWEQKGSIRWLHVSYNALHNRKQFINKTKKTL